MTPMGYAVVAVGGVLILGIAAVGSQVLFEVAWHEVKEYCRRRDRRALFDTIHDAYEEVVMGMESLRVLGFVAIGIGLAGGHATGQFDAWFSTPSSYAWGAAIALLAAWALFVWLPIAIASEWGTPILYHGWTIFWCLARLMRPSTALAEVFREGVRRMGGEPSEQSEEEAFEEEVLAMVTEGMHDGHLEADAREMIEGVMELGDGDVADIMTPRSRIDAVPVDWEWDAVLKFVAECGRTRIPVYEGSIDQVVGILYVKDLLSELSENQGRPRKTLRQLVREPWYVPPTQNLDDLLHDFRQIRNHLAIVRDEFSRVAGLVTIEDVLEEIVGEIVDETDEEHVGEIRKLDERTAVIQGRAHLAEVNEVLGLDLPEPEDFDTIAGYVINHLGRIPRIGEQIRHDSVLITILEASRRKIEQIKLEQLV